MSAIAHISCKKKCKCKFNVKHRECLRDHPSQRLMIKCLTIIQIKLELEMLVFEERGKLEYPEKNLSEQGREPTTNSTHIWRRVRESNRGHMGGRRTLSPLRHPAPHFHQILTNFLTLWKIYGSCHNTAKWRTRPTFYQHGPHTTSITWFSYNKKDNTSFFLFMAKLELIYYFMHKLITNTTINYQYHYFSYF